MNENIKLFLQLFFYLYRALDLFFAILENSSTIMEGYEWICIDRNNTIYSHTLTKDHCLKTGINYECTYFLTPESALETARHRIMKKPIMLALQPNQTASRYPPLATANYQARDISPHVIIMFFKLPPLAWLSSSMQCCFSAGVVSLVLLGDRQKVQ